MVDDHTLVRHGLALVVQDAFENAEVEEAGTAAEAIRILESGPVDIALVDVRMPEVDGIELLKQVRARWPKMPVIMLTTYDQADYAKAAIAEGAAGYMLKDSSPADLSQAVRVALEGGGNVLSSKVVQNLFDEMRPGSPAPASSQPANLTRREMEILGLLVEGNSNKGISTKLTLSEKTVKAHLAAVFRKLGVSNRTQAAMIALSMGLGPAEPSGNGEAATRTPAGT